MLDDQALDVIFRNARSQDGWLPRPVSDDTLRRIYDLLKWGPTSANSQPARFLFVRSDEARKRLEPAVSKVNLNKTMTAPVIAIIGYDLEFYERLPKLFPKNLDARNWFAGKPDHIHATAFRNGTLQGAYLIIAARALGLDCGPMSGFDNAKVDAEFFPGGRIKSNFLCGLGYGDPSRLPPRPPRPSFEEQCQIF